MKFFYTYEVESHGKAALQYKSHVEHQEWKYPRDPFTPDSVHCHYVDGDGDQHGEADSDAGARIKYHDIILSPRL